MSADNSTPLSRDTIFDLLSSRRRRFVLEYLRGENGSEDLADIATSMAASEADTTPEELESHERKRAYVSLYQTHIPRLADEGVITYDADTGHIALAKSADQVLPYLDAPDDTHIEDGSGRVRVYPALAGLGLGVYVLIAFGGAPISTTTVGIVVLASVFLASSVHWLYVEKPFSGS